MQAGVLSDPPYAGIKVWLTREVEASRIPALARRELRGWMGDHPALADLELIASELVTNALVHGAGPWVRMSLRSVEERERRYWRLTVVDPGRSASVPMPRMPGPGEKTGRGLLVVDALTNGCWETAVTQVGERMVWALLPR
ncbi:ATP-binding protein [Nonomuraea purpurea]|uniref:ATP-binding protein n=1 Tax=Nonomuraea purpurea TaxID=1849276 RepID=A0ABV8GEQ8_9ACTN